MAFQINKELSFRPLPLEPSIDLKILELTEQLIRKEKSNPNIKLFSVKYKEIKPKETKPGYRYFNIIEAYNEKDK